MFCPLTSSRNPNNASSATTTVAGDRFPEINYDHDGHLSDIEPSSSSSSSSSSESDSGEDDKESTASEKSNTELASVKTEVPTTNGGGQGANGGGATIVSLVKREFGGRGTFFSVTSEDYLNDRRRKRLVSKKGHVQIAQSHVSQRGKRYLSDIYSTMLDLRWRYVLLIFTASFFLSWLLFAVVWWVIMIYRGDFEPGHLPPDQEANNWQPCVLECYNFASVFLFSVETQHTIGYGSRQTTEKCPEAIFMQSLQSVVGVMIQACMVGTIFAKLARPKKRAETMQFSRNATVCYRDGVLNLLFRVANLRQSHLIEAHVRAIVVSKKVTDEGEVIPFHQTELKVGMDAEGEEDCLMMMWPITIVHPIDEESPFYHMSAKDMYKKHYELIVVLEAIVEPTGNSIQARSSYLGDEILWGFRFKNVLEFKDGCYQIDFSSFNRVEKIETPTHSAKHHEELRKSRSKRKEDKSEGNRSKSAPSTNNEIVANANPAVTLRHKNYAVPNVYSSNRSSMVLEGDPTNKRNSGRLEALI